MALVPLARQTATVASGTFTASGDSQPVRSSGSLFVHIQGSFTATVTVKFSPDNGTNWYTLTKDSTGNDIAFVAPASVPLYPNHAGSLWKLSCAYTSGVVTYVLAGG